MKNIIKGFWESSDDTNMGGGFVTDAFPVVEINGQKIELDRDDPNHPACELLGCFSQEEIPVLVEKAKSFGLIMWDTTDGCPL